MTSFYISLRELGELLLDEAHKVNSEAKEHMEKMDGTIHKSEVKETETLDLSKELLVRTFHDAGQPCHPR